MTGRCQMTMRSTVLLFAFLVSAHADTLTLRNGMYVTGNWIGSDATQIFFQVNKQIRPYSRSEVLMVTFDSGTPPPPVKKEPGDPVTIGQTIDQVEANLGKPAEQFNISTKKIYIYDVPPVKITFRDGKVVDSAKPPAATAGPDQLPPVKAAAASTGSDQSPAVNVNTTVVTRLVPPLSGGVCNIPIAQETAFLTTDMGVWFFVSLSVLRKGEKGRIEWRNPSGTVMRITEIDGLNRTYLCQSDSLPLAGQPASFTPGEWEVRLYWGDQSVASLPFRVSIPPAGALELKGSTVLPLATALVPYYYRFTLAGGTPPYRWSGGDPASGLTLSADGVLSGSPARQGSLRIPLKVQDSAGNSLTRAVGVGVLRRPDVRAGSAVLTTSPAQADLCRNSTAMRDFRTTESRIWLVFAVQGEKANQNGQVQWLNPAGDVAWRDTFRSTKDGDECRQTSLPPAQIKDLEPGAWRVRLLWEWGEVFSLPFTLTTP